MQIRVFIILLAVAVGAIQAESANGYQDYSIAKYTHCLPDYTFNPENKKCYKLFTDPKLWINALNTCRNKGAKLAIPRSSNEAWYLSSELQKHDVEISDIEYYLRYVFVGIVRDGANNWREIDTDRPLNSDIPWAGGEPNNAEGKEKCLTLDRYGQLNDYYCDKPAVFICEYDQGGPFIHFIEELVKESIRRSKEHE